MDPSSTQKFRRVTGVAAVCWAVAAIGFSLFAFWQPRHELTLPIRCSFTGGSQALVEWSTPEAREAGIERGDRLVEIDQRRVWSALRTGGEFLQPGVRNEYRVEKRDGRSLIVSLLPARAAFDWRYGQTLMHLGLLVVALLYVCMGGIVWWNRPDRAEAWAMMLFCSMMAVEVASTARGETNPWWTAQWAVANLPLLGAATFHLFTTHPIEPNWIVRHRRIRAVPYVLAFAFVPIVMSAPFVGGRAEEWIYEGAFFFGTGLAAFSIAVPLLERRRAHEAGVGARTDVFILAAVLSLAPALLVLLTEALLQIPLPWQVAMLWVGVFPLVVGVGILRRQLFDVRIAARSSAAYGAATLAITGMFAFLITFADTVVDLFGVDERSVQVAFLFLAILAFDPLRDRMQNLVDQLFDRDRSRYRSAVREISEAMVSMLSLGEISDRILVALTETMGVGRAVVLLIDERDRVLRPVAQRGDWDEDDVEIEIPADHPVWRQLWMRRQELARVDFDEEPDTEQREVCWDVFDSLEVELLVPILFGVDLLGVIAVGRKLSGERLTADDRQLLRTLANQSAIAIENGKAFDEIAQLNETLEARVEERTRELRETQAQLMQSDKLKSLGQLVAGVAHELNNPIGFVHANLQLLDEYIEKLAKANLDGDVESAAKAREAISKLLLRSREGTERVKQIVMDLRTFSRTDQAELANADLHEEIDRTIALMEPRLKNGIEVHREYGDIPQVRCYPGQLNQVFLNLLMNACDALEGGGSVTIRTRRSDLGVRLEFADDGPGIPPEVLSQIFDPFFTTKPVGVGTGLGLSLSHSIVDRHRGRFTVDSTPGQGASFGIELPLDATPAEE
ncbi:MAG: ATP-binding protein [Myxococcota bacterium]|nr:ATP-binding protein [Myxococcota bacterium]